MTKLLIVAARFYEDIADELIAGATEYAKQHGATCEVVEVPGAFEIPGVIGYAMDNEAYDGFVALGCVIRGETTHYDYVCGESARGLMELNLMGVPVGNGILTTENKEQALKRARVAEGNKGAAAAEAALRMIELKKTYE